MSRARRVVVKIGTALLAPAVGAIASRRFSTLARDVAALIEQRRQVVVVASGAVGLGTRGLQLARRPRDIPRKQAAAAVGQIELCRRFQQAFARRDLVVGQLLLTHGGLAQRERFLNARHTLRTLLELGAVPIVNENDSVATEELRFSDNDQLSALVTNAAGADLLVLLTHTDGLYDRPPDRPGAVRVGCVPRVTPQVLSWTEGASATGTGGMRTKLEAARTAARFGVPTVIADGRRSGALLRVLAGEDVGTYIPAGEQQISARKHWIAYSLKPRGRLLLDSGAVRALRERGRSLLPIGVLEAQGAFGVGDAVACFSSSGEEVARGLVSYGAQAARQICGQPSARIVELLGYSNGPELIHRNDLVLLEA